MNRRSGISFEVFPPKKEGNFASAYTVVRELAELSPDFISVTYGAGGSKSKKTVEIASYIQNELKVPAIAHMTCVGSCKRDILQLANELLQKGITQVLALRGDRPKDMTDEQFDRREFVYAADLIRFLKENTGLRMAAACYPEKHCEAPDKESDLQHLKEKQEAGAEFSITQMFFENSYFYDFQEQASKLGITMPIHAGIMPITAAHQLGTSVTLSGCSVPKGLSDMIAKYGEHPQDMYLAGIDYAVRQIRDLREHGVEDVHIYTMNKPDIARRIVADI